MLIEKETHRAEAYLVNEKVSSDTGEGEVFLSKLTADGTSCAAMEVLDTVLVTTYIEMKRPPYKRSVAY